MEVTPYRARVRLDTLANMRWSTGLALGFLCLLGCKKHNPQAIAAVANVPDGPTPTQLARDARGDQAFAAKLYKAQRLPATNNLFFSPSTVRVAIGMAYTGARGATAEEIAQVLDLDPDRDATARLFGQVLRDWNRGGSALRVANRAWGQRNYKFLPDFLTTLSRDFAAPFGTVDFIADTEGARHTINQWVDLTTEHKIPELLKPEVLNADSRLVLTNALYFKENWASPFDRSQTSDADFHTSSGDVRVPMMAKVERLPFARIAGAEVIKLGYASGERSMIVVLPERVDGWESVEQSLDAAMLASLIAIETNAERAIYLPRFTLDVATSLKAPLNSLGLRAPFDEGRADFSGMNGDQKLSISAIAHQAFVSVNEAGTEAAAATAVVLQDKSEPPAFRADHPFLFLVCDKVGRVLFMGRVVDPTK